eukprot:359159-Chlamydomonas_euryale.AAC.6
MPRQGRSVQQAPARQRERAVVHLGGRRAGCPHRSQNPVLLHARLGADSTVALCKRSDALYPHEPSKSTARRQKP